LQQLPRILEIAPPEQGRAGAGETESRIRRDPVIGDDHPPRRRISALGSPQRGVRHAVFGPLNVD
jgi:hypothetical protein